MGRSGLSAWTVVVAALLFNAMGLPLLYRFGQPKGSTILLSIWGVAVGGECMTDASHVKKADGTVQKTGDFSC